jgi:catechol 2,3-dioxygenase-like lactoylglutathione lyase family enzyme
MSGDSQVLGLQHVSLPFPGTDEAVAQARRFYGEGMGLEERPVPPALPGVIVWFATGDQELHLFAEAAGVAVNGQSRRHACFQVADITAFRSHLEAMGWPTIDHDGEIPGRPRFFARDPFGNMLEFVELRPDHW